MILWRDDILNLIDLADGILRITGLGTLLYGAVQLIIPQKEISNNILIERINNGDDYQGINYYQEYIDHENSGELTMFTPKECSIKELKVYSLKWERGKLKTDEVLKVFKIINPEEGVLLNINYPCGAPSRKLVWVCDYGVKGEHIFAENGFNGRVDKTVYNYKYGVISNIRRMLNWK